MRDSASMGFTIVLMDPTDKSLNYGKMMEIMCFVSVFGIVL